MKRKIAFCFCIALVFGIIFALPIAGEEELYSNVMRLHILANSNSEEDQALKLGLRDELLEKYRDSFSSYGELSVAKAKIYEDLSEIEQFAQEYVNSRGYEYGVSAELGEEAYPTRDYGRIALPAGKYLSLRIIIGEGAGDNWWCVLFPPMCTEAALGESIDYSDVSAGLTKEQYNLISESNSTGYVVKFKILEILEKAFK